MHEPSLARYRLQIKVFVRTFLLCLLATILLAACDLGKSVAGVVAPSSRILFVGNSFTFFNDGVDQQVKALDPSIAVGRLAVGGYTLKDHWNDAGTLATIHGQKWNYVVLQEQSQTPVSDRPKFLAYAGKLNDEIKLEGAETILFMTWQRPDSVVYGVTTQNLASAYFAAGRQLGAKVAPVGLAFAQSLQDRPGLTLYVEDGHPTPAGTYLAGCVLYATIFGKSPVGSSRAAFDLSADDREFLQGVAAHIVGY